MGSESVSLMLEAGSYLPPHVQPWVSWMQVCLFLAPLAFLRHTGPRALLLSQPLNALIAYLVFVYEGQQVTHLFGLGHLAWIAPALLLARDFPRVRSRPYRAFIVLAVATIAVSLVFDVRGFALWARGDRSSVLVGVPAESGLYRPGRASAAEQQAAQVDQLPELSGEHGRVDREEDAGSTRDLQAEQQRGGERVPEQ